MTLKGKVALVTGGSRGAGRGIALELARKGAFVYITGRTTEASGIEHSKRSIDNVLREIKAEGGSAAPYDVIIQKIRRQRRSFARLLQSKESLIL